MKVLKGVSEIKGINEKFDIMGLEVTIINIEVYIEKQLHSYISLLRRRSFTQNINLYLNNRITYLKINIMFWLFSLCLQIVENLINRKLHHHEIDIQLKVEFEEKGMKS